jgi:uncharacterized protein (TIGR03435 family)
MKAVLAALIWCEFAVGQVADQHWEFEVASVKPAPPDSTVETGSFGGPGTSDPELVTYGRTWLRSLVSDAYGVRFDQVSVPDWTKSQPYTIVAKIPPYTTRDQFNLMLRNLLAERFHLMLHHETKVQNVYILSVAPGGPKLTPASAEPDAATAASATRPCEGTGKDRFPALRTGRTESHDWCPGVAYYTYRQTMAEFALGLGTLVNMSNGDGILSKGPPRPFVVDETGLTERFEFTLEFAGSILPASPALTAALLGRSVDEINPPNSNPSAPDIFHALEKQLGLKLEKGKRRVDFLVIDHADKVPTEN